MGLFLSEGTANLGLVCPGSPGAKCWPFPLSPHMHRLLCAPEQGQAEARNASFYFQRVKLSQQAAPAVAASCSLAVPESLKTLHGFPQLCASAWLKSEVSSGPSLCNFPPFVNCSTRQCFEHTRKLV